MKAQLAALLPFELPSVPAIAAVSASACENGDWRLETGYRRRKQHAFCERFLRVTCGGSSARRSAATTANYCISTMAAMEGAVEAWEGALKETSEVLERMVAAVREAGDAALALQRTGLSRKEKDGHYDIVTEGDIASQRIAMANLVRVFPGLPFAAEESDEQARVPGVPQAVVDADDFLGEKAYLALDPVDGTTNFACGGPDWGVAAALVRRDTGPTHGVLYLPGKGIVVQAAKGHGCRVNGKTVRLREGQVLKECLVAAEIGKFVPDDRLQRLLRLVHHSMGIRNLFSSTGNTADILSGVHGAWVHLKGGSVWDFAAGVIAVEEAGGFACDLHGNPLKWNKLHMEVVLAANEEIARQVVGVLDIAA